MATDDEVLLNYRDVAKMCAVPVGSVYALVSRKRIPHLRVGPRTVRFRRSEIAGWLAARHVPEAARTTEAA